MAEIIGDRIKAYRKKAGMTQKELANAAEISLMSIRRYENNERKPRIDHVEKIATALGLDVSDLTDVSDSTYRLRPHKTAPLDKSEQINYMINGVISENDLFEKWLSINNIEHSHSLLSDHIFSFEGNSYRLRHEQFNLIKDLSIEQLKALIISYDKMNKQESSES